MAIANTRVLFTERCLQNLGKPVIEINVSEEQVDNQIDTALQYYADYHFDGTEKAYYKHQITQTDLDNKYLTLPENIIGVVDIFPIGAGLSSSDMFSIRYQIALNDLYTLTSSSMVPYYSAFQHIALLEEILVGKQPIRYNRHRNRLHIDADWSLMNVDEWLIILAYEVVDPTSFTDVWKDRWLERYATALIKRQWGNNTKKYEIQMPGGVILKGQQIYDEAIQELEILEEKMITDFSIPPVMFIG